MAADSSVATRPIGAAWLPTAADTNPLTGRPAASASVMVMSIPPHNTMGLSTQSQTVYGRGLPSQPPLKLLHGEAPQQALELAVKPMTGHGRGWQATVLFCRTEEFSGGFLGIAWGEQRETGGRPSRISSAHIRRASVHAGAGSPMPWRICLSSQCAHQLAEQAEGQGMGWLTGLPAGRTQYTQASKARTCSHSA